MNAYFSKFESVGFELFVVLLVTSFFAMTIAWLSCHALRTKSAAIRFSVWRAAFSSLLVVPLIVIFLPSLPLGWEWSKTERASSEGRVGSNDFAIVSSANPGNSFDTAGPSASIADEKPLNAIRQSNAAKPPPLDSEANQGSNQSAPSTEELAANSIEGSRTNTSEAANALEKADAFPFSRTLVIVSIWALGSCYFLLRIIVSVCRAKAIAANSTLIKNEFDTVIPIAVSPTLDIPVTIGVFRPMIVLPAEQTNWPKRKTSMVLQHELTHVQRGDVFWQVIAAIAKSLVWFQPLAWLGETRMQLEREKACDNAVLKAGANSADYASELLDMAARLSGRQLNLVTALSMAQKPVESRLVSILSTSANRNSATVRFQSFVAIVFLTITIGLGIMRPFEPIAHASSTELLNQLQEDQQEQAKSEEKSIDLSYLPDELEGKVVGPDGNPVAGCTIEVTLSCTKQPDEAEKRIPSTKIQPVITDKDGVYRLDTKGIQVTEHKFYIRGFAMADGFPHYEFTHSCSDKSGTYELPLAKFRQGRKITGQLIPFRSENGEPAPLENATIQLTGDSVGEYIMYWHSALIQCDADGRFSAMIPRVGRVEMRATANNYAGRLITIGAKEQEIQPIELQRGTEVFGQVLDRNNQPVEGIIVNISTDSWQEENGTESKPIFYAMSSSVKTNEQGEYRLPAHTGNCTLSVGKSGRVRGSSDFIHSISKMPILSPKTFALSEDTGNSTLR